MDVNHEENINDVMGLVENTLDGVVIQVTGGMDLLVF